MSRKKYMILSGLTAVALGVIANPAEAALLAPGTLDFSSGAGAVFYGANVLDFTETGAFTPNTPGEITISVFPVTDGAFTFLAGPGSTADIKDFATSAIPADGDVYNLATPVTGFLDNFSKDADVRFDLFSFRRTFNPLSNTIDFNLSGDFVDKNPGSGTDFDDTPIDFNFSVISSQVNPVPPIDSLAFYAGLADGDPIPDFATAPGTNGDGTPCAGATCNLGLSSYSGSLNTVANVPEPASILGATLAFSFGLLATKKSRKIKV